MKAVVGIITGFEFGRGSRRGEASDLQLVFGNYGRIVGGVDVEDCLGDLVGFGFWRVVGAPCCVGSWERGSGEALGW